MSEQNLKAGELKPLQSYRSSKVEVRHERAIAGTGIFAIEPISKDELIAIKAGRILTRQDFYALDSVCKPYCLQVEEDFFFGPGTVDEIPLSAIFINHSCNANVGILGQVIYVATRNIEEGEELAHDYAMAFTEMGHFSDIVCACGSEQCRHRLAGGDWELPELQERYRGYFSAYIAEKIAAQRLKKGG